jgi:D-alanyl-D-alanine carboxypeptidase/D-alanyl-D-alanine-endopeptidase (penicillin-binding protein 4)
MNVKAIEHKVYLFHFAFIILFFITTLSSCSISKQISKKANHILLSDSAISIGHIGISIFEPKSGTYWYNYNADKYFIPASNTKLFTLYAGMKYLGDSLIGLKITETENTIMIEPTGDPTFLLSVYQKQPVFEFLKSTKKEIIGVSDDQHFKSFGKGWAWDDYNDNYMSERSMLPIYGNNVVFSGTRNDLTYIPRSVVTLSFDSIHDKNIPTLYINKITRDFNQNSFHLFFNNTNNESKTVPFITSTELSYKLIADTIHKNIRLQSGTLKNNGREQKKYSIYSQPCDSLFIPMMYNSDNFFAEQTLLMASNEHIGYMSDSDMIDSLLQNDFKDIPQKPRWVDGSGLSRYNLFTPESFIYILNKMKNEFGITKMKKLLPTGGMGTLKNYFNTDSNFIYAKTGTLSNISALSGYLITKKSKLLIFSILANNYQVSSSQIRKLMEHFLVEIKDKY